MGRKKRILAAKVKPEANEIHEDDTDVCKIAQSQHNKDESEGIYIKTDQSNGEVWIQGKKKQERMDGETKKDESVPMDG